MKVMCQPRPGPRCSPHAQGNVQQRHAALMDKRAAYDAAVADTSANTTPKARLEVIERARTEWHNERARFERAMRAYEETPSGQQALEAARDRLLAHGDTDGARDVDLRLSEVRAVRARRTEALSRMRWELAGIEHAPNANKMRARETYIAWAEADIEVHRLTCRWDGLLAEREQLRALDQASRSAASSQRLMQLGQELTAISEQTSQAMDERIQARGRMHEALLFTHVTAAKAKPNALDPWG